jgi:hypothetical protein
MKFTVKTDRGIGPLVKLDMEAKVCASSKEEAKAVAKKYFKKFVPEYEDIKIKKKYIENIGEIPRKTTKFLFYKETGFVIKWPATQKYVTKNSK